MRWSRRGEEEPEASKVLFERKSYPRGMKFLEDPVVEVGGRGGKRLQSMDGGQSLKMRREKKIWSLKTLEIF